MHSPHVAVSLINPTRTQVTSLYKAEAGQVLWQLVLMN
jgi:hypothetical protein